MTMRRSGALALLAACLALAGVDTARAACIDETMTHAARLHEFEMLMMNVSLPMIMPALAYAGVLVFFLGFEVFGLVLVLVATLLLIVTALREERESLAHFGEAYREYMRRTRRFVPFVV